MTEDLAGNDLFWAEVDLSAFSYPQFLAFFFGRPIVGDKEQYELFRSGIDEFIASNPAIVVTHLQTMCRNFSELTKVYSHEQLDQGLWAVFGAAISCEQFLFDPAVDLRLRIDCIESMCLPFRDVIALSTIDKRDSFYWMWWDMILHTFWQTADDYKCDYSGLTDDSKRIAEAMYLTLVNILALNHPACQWSALHGLGHLHHPLGWLAAQSYLNAHRSELSDEDAQWVENCGAGSIA